MAKVLDWKLRLVNGTVKKRKFSRTEKFLFAKYPEPLKLTSLHAILANSRCQLEDDLTRGKLGHK